MRGHAEKKYDAVIIGAGISGLVCGCYLAKAGLRVLIAEQHHKPGGYCTSFKRRGFTFDAAAHSFGGYRNGPLGVIFKELELDKKIRIRRFDPSDIIVTPDIKVSFWSDVDKTIKEFQTIFPEETNNIKKFFYFVMSPHPMSFVSMRSQTFGGLLDQYFTNYKLKAILSVPLFGDGGLPPSQMSAFIGTKIFKEFLLDGGYYPGGSIQALPDALAERFQELNGELRLSRPVKKIEVKDKRVTGVVLEKDGLIPSRYVVSNCDARQTFFKLLGKNFITQDFLCKINNMTPSLSAFILYLGLDKYFDQLPEPGINMWLLSNYDLHRTYLSAQKGDFNNIGGYLMHLSADKKSFLAFINITFKGKNYWNKNKANLLELFIKRIEKDAIPGLSNHIVYKDAATPHTLYRYTRNYKGAAYGWAALPSQLAVSDLRKPSFVQGLYLTGHWTTQGLGIPGVTYIGYDTAKCIVKTYNKKESLSIK